jgi:hypothetical protein
MGWINSRSRLRWFGWLLGGSGVWAVMCTPAFAIEGLPGSTWGHAAYEKSDIAGPGIMGYVNQGIDWVTLPGDLTLNTFAELRYRLRQNNKEFFNAYGPALGVELRHSPFRVGVDYYWEQYPELKETSNRLQLYLSWYYDWDLKRP